MRCHLLVVVAILAAAPACSDAGKLADADADGAEVAEVDATLRAARHALSAGDVAAFMELWTDNGLQQVFHEAGDAFVANTGYYLGAKQYSLGASSAPTMVGSSATVVAPMFFRLVGVVREFSLIKVDGVWRVDGAALTTIGVEDATPIDVEFGESSIRFDSAAITDGDVALQVRNPTTRRHELNILTAPPEQDVAEFFEHPEDAPPVPEGKSMPEGFDFVGGVADIGPGMAVTVLFSQELPPARYVMFCNGEDDTTGEPHSKQGEFLEFTIGTSSG